MSSPFTLTIDWLSFTLPTASARETMQVLEGDWTKAKGGFRGYRFVWITTSTGRGIGKLGTGVDRNPGEVHVDLSAGIVAQWPPEKVRAVLQWVLQKNGHLTRLDCALDDRASSLCLQTCLPTAESHTYRTALAQLLVHGQLQVRGEPRFVSLPTSQKAPASHRHAPADEQSSRPLHRPPATPDGQAAPALAEVPERQDHLEAIVQIIMDATGFDRDEIEPDMDLRRDLSVRSSRLPIIMDAAEGHFGITIELEDFIHVRTVRDIAQRISALVARQEGAGERPAARAADPGAAPAGVPEPSAAEASLKRLVFHLAPVEPAVAMPVELSPGEAVLLLSPDQDEALAKSAGDLLRQGYGVDTLPLPFMPEHVGPGEEGHDILTAAGITRTSERISGIANWSRT